MYEERFSRAVQTGASTVRVVVLQDATSMSACKPPACKVHQGAREGVCEGVCGGRVGLA